MILETLIPTSASGQNLVTSSIDIEIGPSNVAVMCVLNGLSATGTPTEVFAGIQSLITQDPNTGAQSGTDFTGDTFTCSSALFENNVVELTFVVGAIAAGSGLFSGSNFTTVSGTCQVIFNMFI